MISVGQLKSSAVAAAFALLVSAIPAWAGDIVFPTGSRVGLVPPPGMVVSKTFLGFDDPDKNAAILITTLPAAAYPEMEKIVDTDALKKQGVTVEKREPVQLSDGKAFVVIAKQATDKGNYRKWLMVAALGDLTTLVAVQVPEQDQTYSDSVVHAALATLAVRATVPDQEQLSLVPFTVGDLAGFHIQRVLPGRALMLVDSSGGDLDSHLLVAAMPGGPTEPNDYDNFARLAFDQIAGIKDVRLSLSEPLRIGGQSGFQTMAQAKDMSTNTDIMVVQWLRFGSGGFLRMVGLGRAEDWANTLTRLRAVRDSINLR